VAFGASRHLAGALLKMMEFDEDMRAVMNIRYDPALVAMARTLFITSSYSRAEEPETIKKREGASVPWG